VWIALVWLSSFARVLLYRRFDAVASQGCGYELAWQRIWTAAYTVSGLIWGVGSVVLFPADSFLNQAFLAIFVLGMGAGGAASFAPYLPALIDYVVPLIFPIATLLVFQATPPHMILGVSGFVFILALVFLGRAGNRSFAESFRLGAENEVLANNLNDAQVRLEGALDSMSEAFALFGADDRLVEYNDKFRELVAGAGEPPDGLDYGGFLLTLARSGRIRDAVRDPEAWRDDILRKRRAGELPVEIAFVDGKWLMLSDARTGELGSVTTLADVTELKRHGEQLAESEQRFRDFTTAASDWAWELDADGRFTDVSGRYSEVSGRSPDALIGARLVDLPSTDYREDWGRLIAAVDARQPFRNVRAVRPRADRGVFHFLISGVPIFSPSGAFLGYRGTGTDITAMVRAEERARQAQSRLFEAIESIPASFVLFDEQGRLSIWNSRAPEYFPGAGPLIVAGTTFEQLMRACAESGSGSASSLERTASTRRICAGVAAEISATIPRSASSSSVRCTSHAPAVSSRSTARRSIEAGPRSGSLRARNRGSTAAIEAVVQLPSRTRRQPSAPADAAKRAPSIVSWAGGIIVPLVTVGFRRPLPDAGNHAMRAAITQSGLSGARGPS
jgi:PAS domain S-box-containing protein